ALSLATALGVVALAALGRSRVRLRPLAVVAAFALFAAAAQQWLLVARIELVHFPQYALFVCVLAVGEVPLPVAFALAVLAGAADEVSQHLVVYAKRTDTYLDWNDMVLNAIGAGLAAPALAVRRPAVARTPHGAPRRRLVALASTVAALSVLAV